MCVNCLLQLVKHCFVICIDLLLTFLVHALVSNGSPSSKETVPSDMKFRDNSLASHMAALQFDNNCVIKP